LSPQITRITPIEKLKNILAGSSRREEALAEIGNRQSEIKN